MARRTKANELLTAVGSAVEYLQDRGEMWRDETKTAVLTATRYTSKIVDHYDFVHHGRLIRLTATDLGAASAAQLKQAFDDEDELDEDEE